jgi:hypothetical protein
MSSKLDYLRRYMAGDEEKPSHTKTKKRKKVDDGARKQYNGLVIRDEAVEGSHSPEDAGSPVQTPNGMFIPRNGVTVIYLLCLTYFIYR